MPDHSRKGRQHYRGYLPHHDFEGIPQMITFRLADSMRRRFARRRSLQFRTRSFKSGSDGSIKEKVLVFSGRKSVLKSSMEH